MTVTEIPFDLAEVKLDAPLTRPGSVVKADVIAQLCTENVPFATVVAPAGYGKTTLLAQWAEADPRPFAWVALDGRDDDAVVFLRYIAAAIHSVEPLPSDVFSALSGPRASDWPMRIPRIGRALAAVAHPLVLVLDDLHTIANPSCLDVLTALFQYVPAGSQIAVASREEPALPLARWRSQGSVLEIGVADLRLNEVEAGLLLKAAGIELDPTEISELTDQTEGWPAGLYLAALSMQAGGPSPADAEAFKGDDRFVSEYFRLELLSRLPPAEAQFLKYTSVLNRMSGSLCDSVLQTTRSADKLEQLSRVNGFVVPLDRRSEWYRYHHLFGQLAAERARTNRTSRRGRTQRSCDGMVHRQGLDGGRGRLRARSGRDGHCRGPRRRPCPADLLRRPNGDPGGVGRVVQRGRAQAIPRTRRLRGLARRPDGAARRCRAAARSRRRGDLEDPALGWQRRDQAVGRHPEGAHDAERCRTGSRRRQYRR